MYSIDDKYKNSRVRDEGHGIVAQNIEEIVGIDRINRPAEPVAVISPTHENSVHAVEQKRYLNVIYPYCI